MIPDSADVALFFDDHPRRFFAAVATGIFLPAVLFSFILSAYPLPSIHGAVGSLLSPRDLFLLVFSVPVSFVASYVITWRWFREQLDAKRDAMSQDAVDFFDAKHFKSRLVFWVILWIFIAFVSAQPDCLITPAAFAMMSFPTYLLGFCLNSYLPRLHKALSRALLVGTLFLPFGFTEDGGASLREIYAVSFFIGTVVAVLGLLFIGSEYHIGSWSRHYRGKKLGTLADAKKQVRPYLRRSRGSRTFFWGGIRLPQEAMHQHCLAAGTTGSGKTITLRLLFQSVFDQFDPHANNRALIYDAKQDAMGLLAGMRIPHGIEHRTLNPFDARGFAWNMASDITESNAEEAAKSLIPDPSGPVSEPFFISASQTIVHYTIRTLDRLRPGTWTFRHLILVLQDRKLLKQLLEKYPDDNSAALENFEPELLKTFLNVRTTLNNYISPLRQIAAAWDHTPPERQMSFREWTSKPWILILGNDEANRAAFDPINRLMFERLAKYALAQDDNRDRFTWFFLDEVQKLGRLSAINLLLTNGRSKGICVALGFQAIPGLKLAYGPDGTQEIVGMCGTKAFLRMEDEETCRWASGILGLSEVLDENISESQSKDSLSITTSLHLRPEQNVLPSQLMDLPYPNEHEGLTAYYDTPYTDPFRAHLPGSWTTSNLRKPGRNTPNFIARDPGEFKLRPWTREELAAYGLRKESSSSPSSPNPLPHTPTIEIVPDDATSKQDDRFRSDVLEDDEKKKRAPDSELGDLDDIDFENL